MAVNNEKLTALQVMLDAVDRAMNRFSFIPDPMDRVAGGSGNCFKGFGPQQLGVSLL